MLEIRLLGELEVLRDGQAVPLPASRKSRALLAYLAATNKPHLRERLCELLWEGPDDPRAALRWSLTKLRPLVEPHLIAARDRVEFRRDGAAIDILQLCTPANATSDLLEKCAALFRGEFLDGLDLAACFRYQHWCVGERERLRTAHIAILAELTRRLGCSEAALPYARRRVAIDPFDDEAHAALIRLLAKLGDNQEALRHYDQCRQLFERELNERPGPAVEEARRSVWSAAATPPLWSAAAVPPPSSPAPKFVGREHEVSTIASAEMPVLIIGEPGIGKSRLLDEMRTRTNAPTLYGRAFAAEMVRPYGVWIDGLGSFPAETDRARLFDAVVEKLADFALIAIDDLQWIDEASAALLHYVVRKTQLKVVCAARAGEIDDNPHAQRLTSDIRFARVPLGPLSDDETRALVGDARAAQLSGGNPLFAIELSRSDRSGPLMEIINGRLSQLEAPARELVSWAAAIGRQFDADTVGRATGLPAGEMLAALDKLERAAIIRASGDRTYDFTHDLIRDAAYQMMSGPRRTLVHRHVARTLGETHDPDHALAGEIVHHASLAGDHDIAASAAVQAGRRCLRMFAYAEATSIARRGLQILEALSGNARLETEMKLFEILIMCRTPVHDRVAWAGRIAETIELARRAGLHGTAGLGAHLLACLHEETNRYVEAADATIQSAEIGRAADPATAALSMATSARCLLVLQRDVARAEELLQQASAIGVATHELSIGLGYLHAHHGRNEDAVPHLERGLELATERQDHWREWMALSKLAMIALEEGNWERALFHCTRLRPVAARMTGGSEGVRAAVLEVIARSMAGEKVDVDAAVEQLRSVDSKSDLAWVLTLLAARDPDRDRARALAREALGAAEAVGRNSEAVMARCILGLPPQPTRDITARARRFLKERSHGRPRARANVH